MNFIEKIKEMLHTEKPVTQRSCLAYDFLRKLLTYKEISIFLAWDITGSSQAIVVTDRKTRTTTYHKPKWCVNEDDLKRVAAMCYRSYTRGQDISTQKVEELWVKPISR